jgi:DNA polymerase-1
VASSDAQAAPLLRQQVPEPVRGVAKRSHSLASYGEQFGIPKIEFNDWTKYSTEMEVYCVRDVEICAQIYDLYEPIVSDPSWHPAIRLEHSFQLIVNDLHDNGFSFNTIDANRLRDSVLAQLEKLDQQILEAFPPREVLIREFTPKLTKFGTISRTSVPRTLWANIPNYEAGETYKHTRLVPFNPASHKQIIEVLHEAKWKPADRTATHIEALRHKDNSKIEHLQKYGWKINETNLQSLPPSAPSPARLLAKRILLESRRRTLTEWINLVGDDGRIHGKFVGIGAWTHRMAHQKPNTANIPNELDTQGLKKLLGKEMRSLWRAPPNRLLVGVDAEGIQLRIFAHYIDDPEFTKALVEGKKDDQTDPHSLNRKILGSVCKSRSAAKRFIYALLLGAGIHKLAEILGCAVPQAEEALARLLIRYQGFKFLKEKVIPRDARRGYFTGLDGRKVKVPGESLGERRHLMMSGYLQNGEAIIMKKATLRWYDELKISKDQRRTTADGLRGSQETQSITAHNTGTILQCNGALLVNFVHDEWQIETPADRAEAIRVAQIISQSLTDVGQELKLKCPLAGSYENDHGLTIGPNWAVTH